MNTNILKTTFAALALLVVFNSCKDKDGLTQEEEAQNWANERAETIKGDFEKNGLHIIDYPYTKLRDSLYYVYCGGQQLRFAQMHRIGYDYDLYAGKTIDDINKVDNKQLNIDGISEYYLKYVLWQDYYDLEEGTLIKRFYFDTIGPIKIYAIPTGIYPKIIIGDGGKGEMANYIKIDFYYSDGTGITNSLSADISLTHVDSALNYEKIIKLDFGQDSIYIKSDADLPAYNGTTSQEHLSAFFEYPSLSEKTKLKTSILNHISYRIDVSSVKVLINSDTIQMELSTDWKHPQFVLYDKEQYYYNVFSDWPTLYQTFVMGNMRFVNTDVNKKSKFNYICDSYYLDKYRSATDADWLDLEKTFGIAPQELNSYFFFEKENSLRATMIDDYYGNKYNRDSVFNHMVGKDTRIFNEVIEKIMGYAASKEDKIMYYLYETSTKTEINGVAYTVCRLFVPNQQGVLRCLVRNDDSGVSYAFRDLFSIKIISGQ